MTKQAPRTVEDVLNEFREAYWRSQAGKPETVHHEYVTVRDGVTLNDGQYRSLASRIAAQMEARELSVFEVCRDFLNRIIGEDNHRTRWE